MEKIQNNINNEFHYFFTKDDNIKLIISEIELDEFNEENYLVTLNSKNLIIYMYNNKKIYCIDDIDIIKYQENKDNFNDIFELANNIGRNNHTLKKEINYIIKRETADKYFNNIKPYIE